MTYDDMGDRQKALDYLDRAQKLIGPNGDPHDLASLDRQTAYIGLAGPAYFDDTGDPVGMRFRVMRAHNGLLAAAETK